MRLARHLKDSLSLRLVSELNLAAYRNSLAHSTKGTPSRRWAAPTACRRTVSGTVSLPSRGAFHLSLTVLVRYRSWRSTQPWRVVPPASDRVALARPYSGGGMRGEQDSRTGLSPSAAGLSMPFRFLASFVTAPGQANGRTSAPATPARQRFAAYTRAGLGSCAFARRYLRSLG